MEIGQSLRFGRTLSSRGDDNGVFARVALRPGSMAPRHKHEGTFEAFYILAGKGLVDDNGTQAELKVGDVVFTNDGESHSIKNIGETDLEYIALVVNTR